MSTAKRIAAAAPHQAAPEPRRGTIRAASGEKSLTLAQTPAGEVPALEIVAYNGGPIWQMWWSDPVVIDLATAVCLERAPLLFAHNPWEVIGHVPTWTNDGKTLKARALLTGANDRTTEIEQSARKNHPWQASIGGSEIASEEHVAAGKEVTVNGRTVTGPVVILRGAVLDELSVVAIGADNSTQTKLAAKAATSRKEAPMTFEAWLKAQGFDPATITAQQRLTLQRQYEAEISASKTEKDKADKPAEPKVEAAKDTPADPAAAARESTANEYERIGKIEAAAKGHPAIIAKAIREGWDESRVKNEVELEQLRAARPESGPAIQTRSASEAAQSRGVLEAAICMAHGIGGDSLIKAHKVPQAVVETADRDFRNLRLSQLNRILIHAAGRSVSATASPRELFQQAKAIAAAGFSTMSLTGILGNVANKSLLQGYTATPDVAGVVFGKGSNPDFKPASRYRMTALGKLTRVGPSGEIKAMSLQEEGMTAQVETSAALLTITREAIINDDLGVFLRAGQAMGLNAQSVKQEAAFLEYLDYATFFTTARGNYFEGATSALALSSLSTAEKMLAELKDANNRPINMQGKYLLVPPALKASAEAMMKANKVIGSTTANIPVQDANPHEGKWTVHSSPWLGAAAGLANSSDTAWALLSDPAMAAVLEISYLNGNENPIVEVFDTQPDVLGQTYQIVFDFGVDKQDYRGGVFSKGTT